jgi:hypothetical protein
MIEVELGPGNANQSRPDRQHDLLLAWWRALFFCPIFDSKGRRLF